MSYYGQKDENRWEITNFLYMISNWIEIHIFMNVIIRENDEDLDNYECFWSENRLFWYSFHHLSRTKSKLDKFQSKIKSRKSRWKEDSFNDLHFKENKIEI